MQLIIQGEILSLIKSDIIVLKNEARATSHQRCHVFMTIVRMRVSLDGPHRIKLEWNRSMLWNPTSTTTSQTSRITVQMRLSAQIVSSSHIWSAMGWCFNITPGHRGSRTPP